MAALRRDHRIDVLRGVSILLVLLLHFHLAYRLGQSLLFSNGNYGVIVFFAISGYLITSTSLRRRGSLARIQLKRFYTFRFARIYPCLALVLAVITVPGLMGVPYFASNKPVSFVVADLSVLTFWHNILMAHVGYFNYGLNILWSLSVEEVFYLLFPLLCITLRKDWLISMLWIAAICYAPAYRNQHAKDEIHFLYANWSCFDALAMGCSAALLVQGRQISPTLRTLLQLAATAAMLAVFFYAGIWTNVLWGPTFMAAAASLFLWAEGASNSTASKSFEPIAWFGRHSYELYLFHIVVLAAMRNIYDRKTLPGAYKWPWFGVFLLLSSVLAWAIARWYSEPLNHYLRRRELPLPPVNPQRSSSAAAAA